MNINFTHIYRKYNGIADSLSKRGLTDRLGEIFYDMHDAGFRAGKGNG